MNNATAERLKAIHLSGIAVACQTLWDPQYHEKGQRKTIDRNLFIKISVININENEKRESAAKSPFPLFNQRYHIFSNSRIFSRNSDDLLVNHISFQTISSQQRAVTE